MKGDKVRFPQELLQCGNLLGSSEREEGNDVIEDHPHADRVREHGELGANVTIAHNAQSFPSQLEAVIDGGLPKEERSYDQREKTRTKEENKAVPCSKYFCASQHSCHQPGARGQPAHP